MSARVHVRSAFEERLLPLGVPLVILLGVLVRVSLLGNPGFKNDVSTFEAWAISLVDHGFGGFYAQTGFADYPPGYLYILALVGHVWALFRAHDPGFVFLKYLVKLPAVLADVGIGVLIYTIARRFTSQVVALGAMALYLLNPVTIFISAVWGQVDAIAGGLTLLAVYCLLRADADRASRPISWWIVAAWASLAYSLLVKPQAAVVIPIFAAFAFVNREQMQRRVASTLLGIVAAFVVALGLSLPFHPASLPGVFTWLLQRYAFGSSVYDYNSVNAFNLWVVHDNFWQKDSLHVFGLPQYLWGITLVAMALVLVVWRYVTERTPRALLESCAVALLAFFLLATRMHERYAFDGLLFSIVCGAFNRRYLWASIVLSGVVFANLLYSLQYLDAVSGLIPGANPFNLWGLWTRLLSFTSLATFFVLGYGFLGSPADAENAFAVGDDAKTRGRTSLDWNVAKDWFDPREGLQAMRKPLDYIVMGALGFGSFVLSFVNYWLPGDKIFDEVYFARAAEEYLQNLRIYENTHPPLSKLFVTLSVVLFGGMPHGHGLGGWTGLNALLGHQLSGDNAYGWRFLDVVAGGVSVMLLYLLAKRITGSTVFAAIASLLFTFDGMHFVQSRIATPEGFVVCFSIFAVYAFYRFWIASQVEERLYVPTNGTILGIAASASALAGTTLAFLWKVVWPPLDTPTLAVAACYFSCGAYVLARYVVIPRRFGTRTREATFADGSYALAENGETVLHAVDGGTFDVEKNRIRSGALSQNRSGELVYEGSEVTIGYRRDGSVTYASPAGSATYAQNTIHADGAVERGASAALWLVLFTVALGLLVSAKWYGVMGIGVSFVVLIAVWLQRFVLRGRPALWGNPRGFRLDGALVTVLFVMATVYALVWVPDLMRHGTGDIQNVNDVVHRQYDMFEYHDVLVVHATHPFASKWWQWPLDLQPVEYFYQDHRTNATDPAACCVQTIISLPNPLIMWAGLICVPLVGYLAWRERRKGYALIVLTYLLQWLPWMKSPRITFAYHFYVDIPLICLCIAIVLQRLWVEGSRLPKTRSLARGLVIACVAAIGLGFVFFYPILSGAPITLQAQQQRIWLETWVRGSS